MIAFLIHPALRRIVTYGFASVAALAVDLGCYFALVAAGIAAPLAAVAGYGFGIAAHWLASSRIVFIERLAAEGRTRTAQQGLFVASALVGLAITWMVVGLGTRLGLEAHLAKLAAVAASFLATFLLRLRFVFAPQPVEGRR